MSDPIECHKNAPFIVADFKVEWKERRLGQYPGPYTHCSYCGSVHFDDIRKIVSEGGALGGSDWKYGYPHKFYAYPKGGGQEKFYTEHLKDLGDPEFAEFAALLKAHTDIEFLRDEKGQLMYRAPYYGYQR